MEEILHHLGCKKPLQIYVNIRINYQPQLVSLPDFWTINQVSIHSSTHRLVGGFNPSEKYESNWIISPSLGVNMKNLWVATTIRPFLMVPFVGLTQRPTTPRRRPPPTKERPKVHHVHRMNATHHIHRTHLCPLLRPWWMWGTEISWGFCSNVFVGFLEVSTHWKNHYSRQNGNHPQVSGWI